MTGSNAAEIITANIDMTMDCLEFGEALACWERLQRYMERKKLEIETLADAEPEPDIGVPMPTGAEWWDKAKPRDRVREQELRQAVAESVKRCGPVYERKETL